MSGVFATVPPLEWSASLAEACRISGANWYHSGGKSTRIQPPVRRAAPVRRRQKLLCLWSHCGNVDARNQLSRARPMIEEIESVRRPVAGADENASHRF